MSQFKEIFKNLDLLNEAKKDQVLNVITLFSGMGAPEIALDKLGVKYRVIIASDIDPEAESVYKTLHGDKLAKGDKSFIPNVYDVASQKKNIQDSVDLLIAGFSCQSFSSSGKQYGIYSRVVKIPGQDNKKFTINIKKHLSNINRDTGITVNNDPSDLLPKGLPEGTQVTITPDSDGKLSLETLKIAQLYKPKVIILENVANFGYAELDNESLPDEFNNLTEANELSPQGARLGKSGPAKLTGSIKNPKQGGYLRTLGKIFEKIGYSFYPMYLDPTSYTNSVVRRPRIYIVGIRNDIQTGIFPNKLEKFDDKVATNFGLNTTKSKEDYEKLLEKTLDYIMTSKYSQGYMSKNPKDLVKQLITRFSFNRFAQATDYIFNSLLAEGLIDTRNIKLNNFNYDTDVIDKKVASPEVEKFINAVYNSKIPVVIDISDKSDTIDYLSNLITNSLSYYFDSPYINITTSNKKVKKSQPKSVQLPETDDIMEIEDIVESIENNNIAEKVDIKAINKFKEIISKKLLVQFLIKIYNIRSLNYIPTILKGSNIPKDLNKTGSANYFILRNKAGSFAWGFIHPGILVKLMGMYTKNSEGDDPVWQALSSTKLANGEPISVNGIIRRIGNSMSVDVLEKLFKSLISMKAFQ